MVETDKDSSVAAPFLKRRRLRTLNDDGDDQNNGNNIEESSAGKSDQLNNSFFDAVSNVHLSEEINPSKSPEHVEDDPIQPYNIIPTEEATQQLSQTSEIDQDDDWLQQANDINAWKQVTLNGSEITNKNSIDFVRLCLNSISQVIHPSHKIRLTNNTLKMFVRVLYRYGFLQHFKFDGITLKKKLQLRKKSKIIVLSRDGLSTITVNLDLFYKALDKFTEALNKFYWVQYFAVPENLFELPRVFRQSYNQYLIEVIKRFHKAVNDNDWQRVGQLMGSIDIDSNLKAGNNDWYTRHKVLITFNLLWENLFFIGFQRILLRRISPRMKAISIELVNFYIFYDILQRKIFRCLPNLGNLLLLKHIKFENYFHFLLFLL
jgi:hypothetical protein